MSELRALQSDRKAAIEQALEEVDLLCPPPKAEAKIPEPSQFTSLSRFDFPDVDMSRLLLRMRSLREARKQFQSPRKPRRNSPLKWRKPPGLRAFVRKKASTWTQARIAKPPVCPTQHL